MKRNFVELQNFLSQRYPEFEGSIGGETYPPPSYAQLAVGFAGFVQMAAIALMFFGSKVFEVLGMPEPEWYDQVKNNKMMTFASVFMLNSFANSLTATGAFEITVDGQLAFSKLQSGHMPNARDIVEAMDRLGFQSTPPLSPN